MSSHSACCCRSKKQHFSDWCDITSCHGVKDCKDATRSTSRAFWLLLLIITASALAYQVVALVLSFAANPYTTHIDKMASKVGIEFPNITICNLNRMDKHEMERLNMSVDAAEYFSKIFTSDLGSLVPSKLSADKIQFEQKTAWDLFIRSSYGKKYQSDLPAMARKLAIPCRRMLLSCASVIPNRFPNYNCCYENFNLFNNFGYCSVIRPIEGERHQYFAGYYYGFSIVVNPALKSYPALIRNAAVSEGIAFSLSSNPYEAVPIDPIYIKPGVFASVAISLESEHLESQSRFPIFPPPCRKKPSYYVLKGEFTPSSCITDCFVASISSLCNCSMIITNVNDGDTVCDPEDSSNCVTRFFSWAFEDGYEDNDKLVSTKKFLEDCGSQCEVIPCERHLSYKHSISYAAFPAAESKDRIADELGAMMTPEELELFDIDSLIRLTFYFPHIGYLRTEIRETQTMDQLIANIGGQLGLWMGISIVTIVQAIVYFVTCRETNKIDNTINY